MRRLTKAAVVTACLVFLLLVTYDQHGADRHRNGFDLSYSLVPESEILRGGPPRDGIPALTNPKMVRANRATYLKPKDLVIGVFAAGKARAYPIRILIWHEIVNDSVAGTPLAITYCPLCNSSLVFERIVEGKEVEFGVSGLLWSSNVLMFDRKTESLWSQAKMKAVTGPAARRNLKLKLRRSELLTWRAWVEKHPKTLVMSKETDYDRDYFNLPYGNYFKTDQLIFPVRYGQRPRGFKLKEMMFVVHCRDAWKAYAIREVIENARGRKSITDTIDGRKITLNITDGSIVAGKDGDAKFSTAYMYWFSLNSVMPDIPIYGR